MFDDISSESSDLNNMNIETVEKNENDNKIENVDEKMKQLLLINRSNSCVLDFNDVIVQEKTSKIKRFASCSFQYN